MKSKSVIFFAILFIIFFQNSFCQTPKSLSSSEIQLALKKLNTVGSVLYIAAHPDDENTRLLTYFANEKLLRTGYLSITRGDGGQNLIGKEQGELLGLIRTQELLAARRTDGAEQFFTRANDFGYTKNPEETFTFWDHQKVLADVVWVIRNFKPDVIIARFPTTGEGGHGQHTASAILAGEAFKASGDSTKFPEQLKYVNVWQAKSLWWNTFKFGDNNTINEDQTHFDAGVYNPLLGKWYGEIAAESRTQHKSQGFGVPRSRGKQMEYFKPLDGDTSCKNIFCNSDFTWKRISVSEKFITLIKKAMMDFNPEKPEEILQTLLEAYIEVKNIKNDFWRKQKTKELEQLIISCSGLWFEAIASDYSFVSGDSLKLKLSAVKYSDFPVTLNKIYFDEKTDSVLNKLCNKNEFINFDKTILTKANLENTTPYWLKEKHPSGMYEVNNQMLIGNPENEAPLYVKFVFAFNHQPVEFSTPVSYKWTDPVKGEKYRPLEIRPAVTLNFSDHAYIFPDNKPKKILLSIKSEKDSLTGKIHFSEDIPYKIEPDNFPVSLKKKGDEQQIEIIVTPISNPVGESKNYNSEMMAYFTSNDKKINTNKSIVELKYDHISYQTIFPNASAKLIKIDLNKKGNNVGYIEGAGDAVPQCLQQVGYHVTFLNDEMIENDSLNKYDAIITGVRAYNTNERMQYHYQKLMNYIEKGGNLIVQYNTNNFLSTVPLNIGPYPFKISRDRVTDESAAVTCTSPKHPIMNIPNVLAREDFENWIQERGLYYPSEISDKYETIISCNDKGEKPLNTGIILTKYGKGNFVYTSLSFFRELPAGIPGAYRLFVNMISLGKD
ncbi:MAG: PIG-L family deacetylase [Bacteroidota bacterium]